MYSFPFEKILFMSNFTIDMGDPNFRTGAYLKYLEPMAESLSKIKSLDIRYLVSKHSLESIKRANTSTNIGLNNSFIIDYQKDMDVLGTGDSFICKSYNNSFNSKESFELSNYFKDLFGGWEPDLIVCWEFPTTIFRSLFPNTLVVDLMPGLFMRPPYPRTISFDPFGLYKDSVFGSQPLNNVKATSSEIETYHSIRNKYELFFEQNAVKDLILSKLKGAGKFEKYTLVPLQISQYFGYYENCQYNSQFEFLLDVLKNTPEDTGVIVTQYVSGFVEEKAINDKNIDFLSSNFPNFLYSKDFELVDNISQFIVPWADTTCSISSTIGLQAKFFNRKLISPSRSHLSFIADQTDLNKEFLSPEYNNEDLMALLINRQTFLEKRLLEDPEYLASIFTEMKIKHIEGKTGLELLPSKCTVNTVQDNKYLFESTSNFQAAARQLTRLGKTGIKTDSNELKILLDKIKSANVISFDIFDTLLCRTIFKPEDLFLIMQKKLAESPLSNDFPSHIVEAFAQLRAGIERQLRRERDAQIAAGTDVVIEEITIKEVYSLMVERFGGKEKDIEKLIALEQQLEHSVLQERPIGKFLFNEALKTGKPVIIVSDFIHDEKFVATALSNGGYFGYSKLYVSSSIGKKKHSGDLFKHITKELQIDSSTILHIGDNRIGDLERALDAGWGAVRISSARERALEILKERKLSPAIMDKSFFLRTALSLFSEEYNVKTYESIEAPLSNSKERGIVENGAELGFLALGPLLLSFSDWIIQQAKEKDCKSILFFARDCYLPYKITKKILKARGMLDQFNIHYIAASRRGLMGLNIYKPEDIFNVRIDDYARNNPLSTLFERRFGLDWTKISSDILLRWKVDDIHINVGKVTPAAIYGIVYDHVSDSWDDISSKFDKKRNVYKKYLNQEGVDLNKNTLAVDFGYKGSTHKMINGLFKNGLHAAFFMTYADDFGQDPIENAASFYLTNLNPINKQTSIMLNHNLIIETLINEPAGSLIEIVDYGDQEIKVVKEELGSAYHLSKVNEVHRGVLKFADRWLESFKDSSALFNLEMNSADYLLTSILRKPSIHEVEILKGMIFDNSFAGHDKRYILSPRKGAKDSESIWKEGHSVLYPKNTKPPVKEIKKHAEKNLNKSAPMKSPKPVLKKNMVIKIRKNNVLINGTSYPKKIDSLRILHRDTFIEVVSLLAKNSPSEKEKRYYADLVKSNSKKYIAAKLLKENGGIWSARVPVKEKINVYLNLFAK